MADEPIQTREVAAAALAQVQSAARSRLSAAVNEEAPAAPAPVVEPTPAVASPPAPVAAPATPPTPGAPAAAPAKAVPTAEPEKEPEPEPEPAAPESLEPSPEVIRQAEAVLKEQIDGDPEAQVWVKEWVANKASIEALGEDLSKGGTGTIAEMERAVIKAQGQLEAEAVQNDEYAKSGIEQRIRDLKSDLREARGERFDKRRDQGELNGKYTARFNHYRDGIKGRLRASQEAKASDSRINAMADDFEAEWDEAVPRIGTAKGIFAKSLSRFERRAKVAIRNHLNDVGMVKNLDAFLRKEADEYLQDLDEDHREKSAEYGRAVIARSGQPAPASPAGAAPPAAVEPSKTPPQTLKELYARTKVRLEQARRGA